MYIIHKLFTKNFYYNRTSLLKLIFFYNFLNKTSFLDELIQLIQKKEFNFGEKETELLLKVYLKLSPNLIKLELPFGFVWIYEGQVIIYFKNDFFLEDFLNFFENLEKDFQIKWKALEFFEKSKKILEIFEKNSLLRDFRKQAPSLNNKRKVGIVKTTEIDLNSKNVFLFITEYEPKNIKIIIHFI